MASKSNEGKVLASRREGKELHTGPNLCSLCDDPALAYCKTCQKYLCHHCKTGHKKQKQTRGHEVSDIASVGPAPGRVTCLLHPNNEIKHFCETCKNVCCKDCITEKHKGHKYRDVSGYIRQMKDVCQDKAKDIREPFDWMVSKRSTSKTTRGRRVKQYEDIKLTLQDRKRHLIDLITKIADGEIENVSKAQAEFEKEFIDRENKMGASIKRCEQVLPSFMSVLMGSDVNQVIRCLQQLDSELGNALEAKRNFECLENKPVPRVCKIDDNLTMISDIVKTVFEVEKTDDSKLMSNITKMVKQREVRQSNNPKTHDNIITKKPDFYDDVLTNKTKTENVDTNSRDRKIETTTATETQDARPNLTRICKQCGMKYEIPRYDPRPDTRVRLVRGPDGFCRDECWRQWSEEQRRK